MKYLIVGAGPAGLSFARCLKERGESSFLVLEKEQVAGGLCRSVVVDGSPLDIGGGHFLDDRDSAVNEFLFKFLPKTEWNKFERNSKIFINNRLIDHPIESNIWQMDLDQQVDYLKSIAIAGCNIGEKKPEKFIEWIYWKLGVKIAEDYMIPYNMKMFGKALNELGTYWLEKLPNVSFDESIRSCLTNSAHGKEPAHANFYYPKSYGYGEVWIRIAETLRKNIIYGEIIKGIDVKNKTVITENGQCYSADIIINTIPWNGYKIIDGIPEEIRKSIGQLKTSSIQVEYFPEKLKIGGGEYAHWIYYPDMKVQHHRTLVRYNFVPSGKGYWTETNADRVQAVTETGFKYLNKFAYPINTIDKPKIMERLLAWMKANNIYGLGRWGEHQHYNSDVVVARAIKLCERLVKEESNR